MLDVVQVVPQLLDLFIQVRCVPIANLCPSRDPRPYHRAEGIVRNRLAALRSISRDQDQEFKLGNTLRSRTHQGHVTLEDIQELGKLIKPELPEPSSNPRDTIAVVLEPEGCIPVMRVHGSKLDHFEALTGHAHTILDAEYRTTRIELDRQSNQSEQGGKADHTDHRHQEADPPCDGQMETGLSEVLPKDQAARREQLDGELSGQPLVDLHAVFDDDPLHPRLEELLEGKLAAPLSTREDDPVRSVLLDHLAKLVDVLHHAEDDVMWPGPQLSDEQICQGTPSEQDYTLGDRAAPEDPRGHTPSQRPQSFRACERDSHGEVAAA